VRALGSTRLWGKWRARVGAAASSDTAVALTRYPNEPHGLAVVKDPLEQLGSYGNSNLKAAGQRVREVEERQHGLAWCRDLW